MQRIDLEDPDVDFDDWQSLLYQGELFTGEVAEYAAGGRLIGLETYADGLVDGPSQAWYADGSRRSEGRTHHGHAVGEWQEWHPNGQPYRFSTFDGNGNVVARREWDEAGTLVKEYPAPE